MPKIVLTDFDKTWEQNSEENERKIREWFDNAVNWAGLSEQLTKKLGVERFKNVVLSNPQIIFEDVRLLTGGSVKFPKVTFTVAAKDGYQLASGEGTSTTLELKIRVLYTSESSTQNLLTIQGASPTAAPSGSTPSNNAAVIRDVNVYMNYTGPSIVLDEAHPTVGATPNTSINGTSNVEGTFNTKFKNLLVNVVGGSFTQTSLFQAIINYVNKFDPKFRAAFVTEKNGVALTSVQSGTQLKIGSLNDFLYNNKGFLQQVNGDSSAVYFAVNGVGDNKWLSTFLIRIPLTKFVRPISVLEEQTTEEETQESQEGQENQEQGSTTQTNTESSGTGQSSDLTEVSA